MLSEATTTVAAPDAVMWTAAQVAARDGVTKQAVTKKVRELADAHGLVVARDAQDRITAFHVVQYDHLRGRYADPSKTQAPRPAAPQTAPNDSYDEALRQKTWHEAEKRRLELEELKSLLVRRDRVEDAVAKAAERIVQVIDRLPRLADEVSAAVAKDGTHGARVVLKAAASRLRADIARVLAEMSDEAPTEEPSTDDPGDVAP